MLPIRYQPLQMLPLFWLREILRHSDTFLEILISYEKSNTPGSNTPWQKVLANVCVCVCVCVYVCEPKGLSQRVCVCVCVCV